MQCTCTEHAMYVNEPDVISYLYTIGCLGDEADIKAAAHATFCRLATSPSDNGDEAHVRSLLGVSTV